MKEMTSEEVFPKGVTWMNGCCFYFECKNTATDGYGKMFKKGRFLVNTCPIHKKEAIQEMRKWKPKRNDEGLIILVKKIKK